LPKHFCKFENKILCDHHIDFRLESDILSHPLWLIVFMPPPSTLSGKGIMYSGMPSGCPSVR